jgi:uncharacterized protein (TIRG00374 family)
MRSLWTKYVVSILLGGVMVWLAFRGEDFSGFGERLRKVELLPLFGYVGLFAAAHVLRVVRWGVLVRALGPIRWRDVFTAGCVGYMCISVFPLRLGEFVRPYLVRGRGGVTASGALATVVVERVIDGLLFVGLFFVFLSILPPSGNPAVDAVKLTAYLAGAVFLTVLIVLIAAYARRAWTVALLERIGNRVHPGLTKKALGLLDAFLDGLKVLPDRRRLTAFFLMTVVYWVALGVGMRWMGLATLIPDLSYPGGFALLAVLTVGIMVPAGPGFTGTFELALKGGFALLVLAPESLENVALYTIMLHVVQLAVQVGAGALVLMTGAVDLSQIVAAQDEAPA